MNAAAHIRRILDSPADEPEQSDEDLDELSGSVSAGGKAIVEDPPLGHVRKAASSETAITRGGRLPTGKDRGKDLAGSSWKQKNERKPVSKNLRIKYNKVFGYYLEVTNCFQGSGARIIIPANRL